MKKRIVTSALALLMLAGCAGVQKVNIEGVPTYTLAEIEKDAEKFAELVKSGEAVVVRINAGQKLPLKIETALPFAELEFEENTIQFTQDTFLHFSKDGLLISPDAVSWAPIHKGKALKKIYGAQTGFLQIGLSVSAGSGPALMIGVGLDTPAQ